METNRPKIAQRFIWYSPAIVVTVLLAVVIYIFPSPPSSTSLGRVNLANLGTSMAGKPGMTVNNTECSPGVRQVSWSKYSPICEPKWSGYNGGATSPGVSGSTITLTYREPNSVGASFLENVFGASEIGTNAEAVSTMQTYVNLFNKTFELYGRKVVLKPFLGKGDFLNELQGQGLEQARSDALTAKGLNAFADISLLSSTQPYDEYLANNGIVAIGAIAQPQWWFQEYAPFEYSPIPNCDTAVKTLAIGLGRAMANMPAIFAGDPVLQRKTRVFGLIFPENPTYASCGNELSTLLAKKYNIKMARTIEYSIDFSVESSEALSAIAQMKSHGVTTVLCGCDPIFPILASGDAVNQNYSPEWLSIDYEDIFSQVTNQTEWAHSLSSGLLLPNKTNQEAFKAYQIADKTGVMSPQFALIYVPLLLFFDALQAAGPDLTPESFEQGYFRLPNSLPNGNYGAWHFGQNIFSPIADFNILWWNTKAISPQDGKPGTYEPCNGGKRYPMSPYGASLLLNHVQLSCFGK